MKRMWFLVGAIVAAIGSGAGYLKYARKNGEPVNLTMLFSFMVLGLVAGLVLEGIDVMRNNKS